MFTVIMFVITMLMSGVILDIGLTSIYAHFGWELWPTFVIVGAIIGLIKAFTEERWHLPTLIVFSFAGYVCAAKWMVDGILYAAIIVGVYSVIQGKLMGE